MKRFRHLLSGSYCLGGENLGGHSRQLLINICFRLLLPPTPLLFSGVGPTIQILPLPPFTHMRFSCTCDFRFLAYCVPSPDPFRTAAFSFGFLCVDDHRLPIKRPVCAIISRVVHACSDLAVSHCPMLPSIQQIRTDSYEENSIVTQFHILWPV